MSPENSIHRVPKKAQASEQVYLRTNRGELVSSARQEKKALGMSGRQFRKHRKKLRREGFQPGKRDRFGNTVYEL